MTGYLTWGAGAIVLSALATWAVLVIWVQWFRRDQTAAERMTEVWEEQARRRAKAEARALEALATSERRHRALAQAGAVALWRAAPDGRTEFVEGWERLTGKPPVDVLGTQSGWIEALIAEDRERARVAWAEALACGVPYAMEYRIAGNGGEPRWFRSRGVPVADDEGKILEWVGVIEDIDDRRRSEEAERLLGREINHRAKNLLSVVQAILRMTPTTDRSALASVTARLDALARAHDLLLQRGWRGAGLREALMLGLEPYVGPDSENPRIRVEGVSIIVVPSAVQPLSIIVHELAVNALKHGALGSRDGTVALSWEVLPEAIDMVWVEHGGPRIARLPDQKGFGCRIIEATVRQLGGTIETKWVEGGLVCRLLLPRARLSERQNGAHGAVGSGGSLLR